MYSCWGSESCWITALFNKLIKWLYNRGKLVKSLIPAEELKWTKICVVRCVQNIAWTSGQIWMNGCCVQNRTGRRANIFPDGGAIFSKHKRLVHFNSNSTRWQMLVHPEDRTPKPKLSGVCRNANKLKNLSTEAWLNRTRLRGSPAPKR